MRTSIPLLIVAMCFLAASLGRSHTPNSTPSHSGLLRWRTNATEAAVDFTKNDLILGTQDTFFWILVPLAGFLSIGICAAINYAILSIVTILSFAYGILRPKPAWIRNDDKR